MCWECYLANPVHPEKCKLVAGKVRSEVRFSKVENINWVEFEVREPSHNNAFEGRRRYSKSHFYQGYTIPPYPPIQREGTLSI